MKFTEIKKLPKRSPGKIIEHNIALEPHEKDTIAYLSSFGFNIELIVPSSIPHSNNPDLEMLGTVWEMKGPTSSKENTIKKRFRKAIRQANGRAIFDLRNVKQSPSKAETIILNLFTSTRGMRRIVIIKKDGTVIDITK